MTRKKRKTSQLRKIFVGIFLGSSFLIMGLFVYNTVLSMQRGFPGADVLNAFDIGPTPTPVTATDPNATPSASVQINYGAQTTTTTGMLFGGTHNPSITHTNAWNQESYNGITMVRRDLLLEKQAPQNVTLLDYQTNVNNIQSILNWNTPWVNWVVSVFSSAKSRGMKVMGILSYAPPWLTYSGTQFGVPRDWNVYEDIVRKAYDSSRPYMDYIEIWNEPTSKSYLDVTGSGLTKEQAYDLILQHAIKAIKDVESTKTDGKKILIGGFVAHTIWESSMLEYLLQNSPAMNQLDFISYHDYGNTEPSWGSYKDMLAKYGKSNIPIYVTEWNYNSSETTTSPYNTSTLAISYTGSKFVDFMKMGVQVADYFALTPLDTTKPNNGEGLMGFYRWNDLTSTASLLPQVKTWRLMSKTLGLGTGVSKIMSTTNNGVNAVGFINSIGKYGAVAVNSDAVEKVATIQLSNIPLSTSAVNFYIADGKRDGFTIIENRTINNVNGNATIQVKIPPQAILGMLY